MYQIGNFFIFVAVFPLIAAFWVQGVIFLASLPNPQALVWFFVGVVGMFGVCILLNGMELGFTEIATHEMTHALAGEPFMGEPTLIRVTAEKLESGDISVDGETGPVPGWGAFWMYIAPYSFPILAIPPLILRLLPFGQTPPASLVIDVLLGAALGFHYHCLWSYFGVQQDDFAVVGKFVGVATALTFQLVFLVIALSAVMGMPQLIGSYFWAVWERTWYYYGLAFGWLSEAWAAATQ